MRIVVVLIVLFLVISLLGLILDTLRWLLGVAVVIALISLLLGALNRTDNTR